MVWQNKICSLSWAHKTLSQCFIFTFCKFKQGFEYKKVRMCPIYLCWLIFKTFLIHFSEKMYYLEQMQPLLSLVSCDSQSLWKYFIGLTDFGIIFVYHLKTFGSHFHPSSRIQYILHKNTYVSVFPAYSILHCTCICAYG